MLFKFCIVAFTSVAFIAQGAAAGLTPDQVVTNIGIVTTVSQNAIDALSSITTSSNGDQIRTAAKNLKNSFNTMVTDINGDSTAMDATTPYTDCPATDPIGTSLTNFVTVHQALLSKVVGKHEIFAQFGLTAPIADVLRRLENGIDTFASAMIALLGTCNTDGVQVDQSQLDQSVGNTIKLYTEPCLPNPLYPILMPICVTL